MSIYVNLVFEDDLSEYVLTKLLNSFGDKFETATSYNCGGFGKIKSKINGFNEAAISQPFFVLTDLDRVKCPITLIKDWFDKPIHNNLIFRVAVTEVEAWLLADTAGFSKYIGVSSTNFPGNPELEPDPKSILINLVKRCRRREIREDIVPISDNARIGPNYNGRLMEFVFNHWNIEDAMNCSDSLRRAYQRLQDFQYIAPLS